MAEAGYESFTKSHNNMKTLVTICWLLGLLLLAHALKAQLTQTGFTPESRLGSLRTSVEGSTVYFALEGLPSIQGDTPLARYTFFWDFGDGNFAYVDGDSTVYHLYADAARYSAHVEATAIYSTDPDDDPDAEARMRPDSAPATEVLIAQDPPVDVLVQERSLPPDDSYVVRALQLEDHSVGLKEVRQLVEKSPVTFVLGVKDSLLSMQEGGLLFEFQPAHFSLIQAWGYPEGGQGRKLTFAADSGRVYFPLDSFDFTQRQAHLYVSLLADESLEEGQSFPFSISRLNGAGEAVDQQQASSTVQKAHDPNVKRVSPSMLCPKVFERSGRMLEYSITFHNTGGGYAERVVVWDSVPAGVDLHKLEVLEVITSGDTLPAAAVSPGTARYSFDIFPKQRRIRWQLEEVHLPGMKMKQAGGIRLPLAEARGFIRYRLPLRADISDRISVLSHASIVFDDLDSVPTGMAVLRPLPGCCDFRLSPGEQPPVMDLLKRAAHLLQVPPDSLYEEVAHIAIYRNGKKIRRWITPRKTQRLSAFAYPLPTAAELAGGLRADTLKLMVWNRPRRGRMLNTMQLWQSKIPRHEISFRICYPPEKDGTEKPVWWPSQRVLIMGAAGLLLLGLLLWLGRGKRGRRKKARRK
ncbi:MAG: DUF11 domain-containing protein [Bacteroidetes bacterium]|nr:MAG: DUF11 domain-containing protein [Bacteroidota bacterium]